MDYFNCPAPAKINLSIDILGFTENGYHEVNMIMQTIPPLCDIITVYKKAHAECLPAPLQKEIKLCRKTEDESILLTCSNPRLPVDERNLAYRAAKLIMEETKCTNRLGIHIQKRIPVGGGLGGGSSDAAATANAMNNLYHLNKKAAELKSIVAPLGSDIPFFIEGGTALATGTGTTLTHIPQLRKGFLVVVNPGRALSTKKVYEYYDTMVQEEEDRPDTNALVKALERNDLHFIAQNMKNVLEKPAFALLPEIRELKKDLAATQPLGCLMSGSGSTLFALYQSRTTAQKALDLFRRQRYFSFLVALGPDRHETRQYRT